MCRCSSADHVPSTHFVGTTSLPLICRTLIALLWTHDISCSLISHVKFQNTSIYFTSIFLTHWNSAHQVHCAWKLFFGLIREISYNVNLIFKRISYKLISIFYLWAYFSNQHFSLYYFFPSLTFSINEDTRQRVRIK